MVPTAAPASTRVSAIDTTLVPAPRQAPRTELLWPTSARLRIPRQTPLRPRHDPQPPLDTAEPGQRPRNGAGVAAYATSLAALTLCWSPLTRDIAVILVIVGITLSVLALLHTQVGIADNSALAAVAGLTCLAALVLPIVLATAVIGPSHGAVTDKSPGQVASTTCLVRGDGIEKANACR